MFRWKTTHFIALPVLVLSVIFAAIPPASAQKMESDRGKGTVYSLSFTPLYQFDTDLDRGGKFNVSRYYFGFDASHAVGDAWRVGIGVLYDFENYDFSGTTGFAGLKP